MKPRTYARWLSLSLLLGFVAACAAPAPVALPTLAPSAPLATPMAALATQAPTAALAQPTASAVSPTSAIAPAETSPTSALAPVSVLELATATPALPFPTRTISSDTINQLRLIGTIGYGGARSAALAPDGHLLAVGTTAGLALFELPGARLLRFEPINGGVGALAFSLDGTILAASRQLPDAEVTELRRVVDNQLLGQMIGGVPRFLPDHQTIATLTNAFTRQPTTHLWRVADRQLVAEIAGEIVGTSLDARFFATRDSQYLDPLPALQLRSANGTQLFERPGRFAAFSPDGQICAIADDTSVQLVHLPDGQLLNTLATGAVERVWAVAFSRDGRQLLVQADADLQTWSIPEARLIRRVPDLAKHRQVNNSEFTASGDVLVMRVSLGDGATNLFVRTTDGSTLHEDLPYVVDVTYSADDRLAALTTSDMFANGRVRVLDLISGVTADLDIIGFQNLAFSPDAQMLAASTGAQVQLYEVTQGRLLRALHVENGPIAAQNSVLAFAPDGQVLSLSGDLNIPYGGTLFSAVGWQVANGDRVAWQLPSLPAPTALQAVSTIGGHAVADGSTVMFEGQATGPITRTLDRDITALNFSPSGELLAIGDASGKVWLLNASDGSARSTYQDSVSPPQLLAFSADGSLISTLRGDGSVDIWRVGQPQRFARLAASPNDTRLIFSADNQLAISAGPGGVKIFGLPHGVLMQTLPVAVEDIALGPRRRVLALLHDQLIQFWGVE